MKSPFVTQLLQGLVIPIRSDNGYGCCSTCVNRDSDDCSDCYDAELYEPDLDAIEELTDAKARQVA